MFALCPYGSGKGTTTGWLRCTGVCGAAGRPAPRRRGRFSGPVREEGDGPLFCRYIPLCPGQKIRDFVRFILCDGGGAAVFCVILYKNRDEVRPVAVQYRKLRTNRSSKKSACMVATPGHNGSAPLGIVERIWRILPCEIGDAVEIAKEAER